MRKYHVLIVIAVVFLTSRAPKVFSQDAECEKLISRSDARDARAWLASGQYSIGEYDHAMSAAHVEDLYKRGAVSVYAVEIETETEIGQWTDQLIVELPESKEARIMLFQVEAELARLTGEFTPEGDRGQKYLLLWYEASGITPPGLPVSN